MTLQELAAELKKRYDSAGRNQVILEIDLFGIDYGEEIRKQGYPIKDIVKEAGIGMSYITEVSKGVNLSTYVSRRIGGSGCLQ